MSCRRWSALPTVLVRNTFVEMRSTHLVALLVGCGAPAAATIDNTSPHAAPTGFPCGVSTRHELAMFDEPVCDAHQVCTPGALRRAVGPCTIAKSSTFDLYAGRDRYTLHEDGRPILSSEPPPSGRTVVFDARIPTPQGIRVGMTGAEVARLVPPGETECTFDDPGWASHLLCRYRDLAECDAEDANWFLVVFDPGERKATPVVGEAARALVRTRRAIAIDLGPSCD